MRKMNQFCTVVVVVAAAAGSAQNHVLTSRHSWLALLQNPYRIPVGTIINDDDNRAYALVLSGNHVYTSGAGGTHAATIRGAVRAERPDLLTVVLPQSRRKQSEETQKLLEQVEDVVEMPQNNEMSLDIASRICNSYLLSLTDQLISFAFHESNTVIEATNEAKKMDKLVTVLFLD
jgi:hypothetical protein